VSGQLTRSATADAVNLSRPAAAAALLQSGEANVAHVSKIEVALRSEPIRYAAALPLVLIPVVANHEVYAYGDGGGVDLHTAGWPSFWPRAA
jgi:hypothetical protein